MQATGSDQGGILRRKLEKARQAGAGGPSAAFGFGAAGHGGAAKAWRVALARAAQNTLGLTLDITGLSASTMSLAEVVDLPPDRGLILMLDGPEGGLGVMILSPDVLAGMVEKLTTGRCATAPPESRKPTRTDAAMIAPMVDRALENLELALAEDADLVWTSGFRHASHVDEARAVGLLLDDVAFRVLLAKVSLEQGARAGELILILPAEGRGQMPVLAPARATQGETLPDFAAQLARVVDAAQAQLAAVIARVQLPLADVTALSAGEMLPLGPQAAIDRISLETLDGRVVGTGRLGQHRGVRAVRLADAAGGTVTRALSDLGALGLGAGAGLGVAEGAQGAPTEMARAMDAALAPAHSGMGRLAEDAMPDPAADGADDGFPDFSARGGFSLDDLPLGATGTDG